MEQLVGLSAMLGIVVAFVTQKAKGYLALDPRWIAFVASVLTVIIAALVTGVKIVPENLNQLWDLASNLALNALAGVGTATIAHVGTKGFRK